MNVPKKLESLLSMSETAGCPEKSRVERNTSNIHEVLGTAVVSGMRVVEVGGIVRLPYTGRTILLATVKLEDGRIRVLGYENGTLVTPKASEHSWVLDNLSKFPQLELHDGYVNVLVRKDLYIIADYAWDKETGHHSWQFVGCGCSGSLAELAFAKHGMMSDAFSS